MATTFYSPTQQQKARAALSISDKWARGTVRTTDGANVGVVLFRSESDESVIYMTRCDGQGCNCPGAQKSARGRCWHQLAASLDADRARNRPRKSYSDLFSERDDLTDAF
jgi:hypothetical protein